MILSKKGFNVNPTKFEKKRINPYSVLTCVWWAVVMYGIIVAMCSILTSKHGITDPIMLYVILPGAMISTGVAIIGGIFVIVRISDLLENARHAWDVRNIKPLPPVETSDPEI